MPAGIRLLSATWKSTSRGPQSRIARQRPFSSMLMWKASRHTPHSSPPASASAIACSPRGRTTASTGLGGPRAGAPPPGGGGGGGRRAPPPRAPGPRERHRLLAAGDEVRLEAVERLDGQSHAE